VTPLEARQIVIDALGNDWWHVSVSHNQQASSWNCTAGVSAIESSVFAITWSLTNGLRREVIEPTLDKALAFTLELIAMETKSRMVAV
jgi:hypothetical protein